MNRERFHVIRLLALSMLFVALVLTSGVHADEAPRGTWMAEWLRPNVEGRTMGVLTLRDGILTFAEQGGDGGWRVEVSTVKKVASANDGRALLVQQTNGTEYVVAIMKFDLMPVSPKKVMAVIQTAVQLNSATSR